MSEAMSSPEDIARARQIKELEPLHEAWTLWAKTKEVSSFFRLAMSLI
jgi:peptide chain release factor 1